MKLIMAVIREERVPFVQKALAAHEIYGMTLSRVEGRGNQGGLKIQYRNRNLTVDMLPKIAMEIVIDDKRVDVVIEAILQAARTGKQGDGRIFVLPVIASHRVRTGEVEA